jgi:protocatechuate 3,4-dioxygenase beta subunit
VTRPDIEGPYFKPSSPERTSLLEGDIDGVRLTVRGRVVDGNCEPIAGAIIDFWQADDDGAYDNAGFLLRGHQVVDADGRYEVSTIVPGRYLNGSQYRPAHVHCKVYVRGVERLTTQLYFEGDPYNEVDPWFSELTMLRPREDGAALVADFDFSVA